MPKPTTGENQDEYLGRCIPHLIKKEGKTKDQAVGACYGMWRHYKGESIDILSKLNKILDAVSGATTTGDVAKNYARGQVDVVGGECPKGFIWSRTKKVCIKEGKVLEASKIDIFTSSRNIVKSQTPRDFMKLRDKLLNSGEIYPDKKGNFKCKKCPGKKFASPKMATKHYLEKHYSGFEKYESSKEERRKKMGIHQGPKPIVRKGVKLYWSEKLKKYVSVPKESVLVGGTYGNANTNIAGSQQTRSVGSRDQEIEVLKRNPRPLKFNKLLGIYLPSETS